MLKLFRKFAGLCVLMAGLAGCGGMDTTGFFNASAVPTNTDIPFRSGIQYSAPHGFVQRMHKPFRRTPRDLVSL